MLHPFYGLTVLLFAGTSIPPPAPPAPPAIFRLSRPCQRAGELARCCSQACLHVGVAFAALGWCGCCLLLGMVLLLPACPAMPAPTTHLRVADQRLLPACRASSSPAESNGPRETAVGLSRLRRADGVAQVRSLSASATSGAPGCLPPDSHERRKCNEHATMAD